MNKEELKSLFESMTPDELQKTRMRKNILSHDPSHLIKQRPLWRRVWLVTPAACLVLVLCILLILPINNKNNAYALHMRGEGEIAEFKLLDRQKTYDELGTSVNNVDARPGLEFYIDGKDIAKIEISTENEYIYAVDWTKTQHEKFWNSEYYQHYDEKTKTATADFSLLYDKKITMNFDENFSDYDQIWYRWTAWNMHQWASEDNFSHFLGVGEIPENLSEKEKAKIAAGDYKSGNGHMQLDDYPEHLKEDRITIKITNRQGEVTTKIIQVKVNNNEFRQTVVSASLVE